METTKTEDSITLVNKNGDIPSIQLQSEEKEEVLDIKIPMVGNRSSALFRPSQTNDLALDPFFNIRKVPSQTDLNKLAGGRGDPSVNMMVNGLNKSQGSAQDNSTKSANAPVVITNRVYLPLNASKKERVISEYLDTQNVFSVDLQNSIANTFTQALRKDGSCSGQMSPGLRTEI